jgi:hypothetical protein
LRSGAVRSRTPPALQASATRDRIGRPARKADQSFGATTPCSQSQIRRGHHLARRRTAQVMAAMGLSVGVRLRLLTSVVNGTVVARPARTILAYRCAMVTGSAEGLVPSMTTTCLVAKGWKRLAYCPYGLPIS